ncbi:hypothetical protein PR048_025991 [Dryococelus australis]|uniref:Transmembrane protein n=1 Tax=Dryococelus australis TaxID=614101 RepID=A0ABQ9GK39_9NEOP|nr:hypothetical protein PR048_025991 [Dryococelus australis]
MENSNRVFDVRLSHRLRRAMLQIHCVVLWLAVCGALSLPPENTTTTTGKTGVVNSAGEEDSSRYLDGRILETANFLLVFNAPPPPGADHKDNATSAEGQRASAPLSAAGQSAAASGTPEVQRQATTARPVTSADLVAASTRRESEEKELKESASKEDSSSSSSSSEEKDSKEVASKEDSSGSSRSSEEEESKKAASKEDSSSSSSSSEEEDSKEVASKEDSNGEEYEDESGEVVTEEGEMLEVAEAMVFRPFFAYKRRQRKRQQQDAQRRRSYKKYKRRHYSVRPSRPHRPSHYQKYPYYAYYPSYYQHYRQVQQLLRIVSPAFDACSAALQHVVEHFIEDGRRVIDSFECCTKPGLTFFSSPVFTGVSYISVFTWPQSQKFRQILWKTTYIENRVNILLSCTIPLNSVVIQSDVISSVCITPAADRCTLNFTIPTELKLLPVVDTIKLLLDCLGAAVAERSDFSPPTKAKRVQSPAGSLPDFRKWESCRTMPLVGGFSRGSPVSPALSLRRCSILTSITLICSQDFAVKSRPNLFTHSLTLLNCLGFLYTCIELINCTLQQNGVTGQQNVRTPFANLRMDAYSTSGSVANRGYFATRGSQLDIRPIPKATNRRVGTLASTEHNGLPLRSVETPNSPKLEKSARCSNLVFTSANGTMLALRAAVRERDRERYETRWGRSSSGVKTREETGVL